MKFAKGSCAEVRNMLILSKELKLTSEEEIQESVILSIEISTNISNFIKYLNANLEKNSDFNFLRLKQPLQELESVIKFDFNI